jgi:hypothetical protein
LRSFHGDAFGPPLAYHQAQAGAGVQVGSRGGVSVGGQVGATGDAVLDSVMTGATLGSAGGPIGMAVGAGIGFLHGLWAKRKQEETARAEAERQKQLDRDIERQAMNRPHGPSADDEQGVTIVKDHLADVPSASPGTSAEGASGPLVASIPPGEMRRAEPIDADGFRAVHENGHLVRRERIGADGTPEVVLHYDERGQLVRRQDSSRLDGRLDTTVFYAEGKVARRESDTDGDGQVDVWASYDVAGALTRLESLVDGDRRLAQVYGDGQVVREEERGADGALTAVSHYEHGRLVRRELYEVDETLFRRVPLVSAAGALR